MVELKVTHDYIYMKINYKIVLLLSVLLYSCKETNNTGIYLGQYFIKGQEIYINIDNGKFTYKKSFKSNYVRSSPKLLRTYSSKNDSIKVQFKLNGKDSAVNIKSLTEKILIGGDKDGDIFIYTEENKDVWIVN